MKTLGIKLVFVGIMAVTLFSDAFINASNKPISTAPEELEFGRLVQFDNGTEKDYCEGMVAYDLPFGFYAVKNAHCMRLWSSDYYTGKTLFIHESKLYGQVWKEGTGSFYPVIGDASIPNLHGYGEFKEPNYERYISIDGRRVKVSWFNSIKMILSHEAK